MAGRLYNVLIDTPPNADFQGSVGWQGLSNINNGNNTNYARTSTESNTFLTLFNYNNLLPSNAIVNNIIFNFNIEKGQTQTPITWNFNILYPDSFIDLGFQQQLFQTVVNGNAAGSLPPEQSLNSTSNSDFNNNIKEIINNIHRVGGYPTNLVFYGQVAGNEGQETRLYQFRPRIFYYLSPTTIRSGNIFGQTSIKTSANSDFIIDSNNPRNNKTDSSINVLRSHHTASLFDVGAGSSTRFQFFEDENRIEIPNQILRTSYSSNEIIANDPQFQSDAFTFGLWFQLRPFVDYPNDSRFTLFQQNYNVTTPSINEVKYIFQYNKGSVGVSGVLPNSFSLEVKVGSLSTQRLIFAIPTGQEDTENFTKPRYFAASANYSTPGIFDQNASVNAALFTKIDNDTTIVDSQEMSGFYFPTYENTQVGGYHLKEKTLIGIEL
jgi:hypothetical protein